MMSVRGAPSVFASRSDARWRNTPSRSSRPKRAATLGRRPVGDDPPVRHEHHALAQPFDLDHVVARHQERGAVVGAERLEADPDPQRDVGVERRRRLVEDEQRRAVQRGLDDAHQGALTRRELIAHRLREVGDAEAVQPALYLRAWVGDAVELPEQGQELLDAQAFGQGEVPGCEPDLLHGGAALPGEATTDDLDVAAVGRDDAQEHHQRGRLAGAVGPEERDALACRDVEVDAVDGTDALVLLHQSARGQDRRGGRHSRSVAEGHGGVPDKFCATRCGRVAGRRRAPCGGRRPAGSASSPPRSTLRRGPRGRRDSRRSRAR